MPNLVGIGNSQVPTNAMLGGLAYQDSVGKVVIDKIKAKTGDTAVDIFVYDTRKDSDGGAWRYRTQNKSWYNESASVDRGARKEFPTIAIIVAENDILTIYDGDDPNIPMWMVFRAGGVNGTNMIGRTTENTNCVSMLNGLMCVGRTSFGLHMINFIADRATFKEAGYDTPYTLPIGTNRNGGNDWVGANVGGNDLVNDTIVDVAMTVLSNAPIDVATGLPVPIIAVTTPGGTNIINDDGTVTLYTNIATQHVDLHPSGYMLDGVTGAVNDNYSLFEIGNTTRVTSYGHRVGQHGYNTYLNHATGETIFEGSANKIVIAQIYGLLRIEENLNDYVSGLHNRTTSSYNTGWMAGDIKRAFLADTVTEKDGVNYALQATQHATGRLTAESYDDGDTHFHIQDDASSDNGYLAINLNGLTVGQAYKITMTRSAHAHLDTGYDHRIDHNHGTQGQTYFYHWDNNTSSSHVVTGVFVAKTSGDDDLVIYSNGAYIEISNFKIEETDDINGYELVTNGTFDNNVNSWSAQSNWGTLQHVSASGRLRSTNANNQNGFAIQQVKVLSGQTYVISADLYKGTNSQVSMQVNSVGGSQSDSTGGVTTDGTYSFQFTPDSNTIQLNMGQGLTGNGKYTEIDNVSVHLAEKDRSANNKGLQVFGTITKSPVATGAELIGYSGFSANTYFKQSGSLKVLFGTGDFSIIFWTKYSAGNDNQSFIDISSSAGGVGDPRCRIHQFHTPSGSIRFYTTGGNVVSTSNRIDDGWICVAAIRRSSGLEIYINGELENSGNNSSTNFNSSVGQMVIGMDGDGSDPLSTGSMALVRVSATAPSSEQVKKIYNDEKYLFHENAKCTLHGTSDDVKALAFDDTTNILHVGTSGGRSDFRGLNRINNTTTAVTTAISASNGLVAEQ